LAIGLGVCEWFRSVAFTGFPWNNLGMALAGNLNLAQVGSIIGLHGMTFVAIFLAAAPASMTDIGRRKKIEAPSLALLLFICLFAGGAMRLTLAISSFEPDVNLRIVQPNIEQGTKFVFSAMDKILKKHVDLSLGAAEGSRKSADLVSHFIWPESPFPIPLSMAPAALSKIAASLPASSMLFTGAIRPEFQSSGQRLFYNSIHAISSAGEIAANYDKQHLVPFGEYLPLSSFFTYQAAFLQAKALKFCVLPAFLP
jgi:apolipoprotein N-acyltransferase